MKCYYSPTANITSIIDTLQSRCMLPWVIQDRFQLLQLHAGGKVKSARGPFQRKSRHASKGDEAREILASVVLCHVPVVRFNFQAKVKAPVQQAV